MKIAVFVFALILVGLLLVYRAFKSRGWFKQRCTFCPEGFRGRMTKPVRGGYMCLRCGGGETEYLVSIDIR